MDKLAERNGSMDTHPIREHRKINEQKDGQTCRQKNERMDGRTVGAK